MRCKKRKTITALLFIALLVVTTFTWADQNTDAAQPPDDPRVDQLIHQANQRVTEGESSKVVERWLTDAVNRLGVEKTPEAWDVYGRHRWKDSQPSPAQSTTDR